jgi:translation initiation factor 2B subunit (eIF-2B alpha/beta/delta family)
MNLNIVLALGWALQFLMCVRVCMSVGKVLSRDLTQQLNNAIQFLVHCRPLSISMGNAIKYVKLQASHLLSFAYQRHSVTRPQSTSMGVAIKYVKLQASPLLPFLDQNHSDRLTDER